MKRLKTMRDQDGHPLEIVELPMPRPLTFDGCRLPASYANFYIANGLVLVPTFNDPNDRIALDILARLFPRREVIGIHSIDFAWASEHCIAALSSSPPSEHERPRSRAGPPKRKRLDRL